MSLRDTAIKYATALITGFLMTVVLTIGFVSKRSRFGVKKRDVPPRVLTDSALWKHGHLSLRVSTAEYLHRDLNTVIRIMYRVRRIW